VIIPGNGRERLRDEKVVEMDEYWADDGEAPSWRKELGIGIPIH